MNYDKGLSQIVIVLIIGLVTVVIAISIPFGGPGTSILNQILNPFIYPDWKPDLTSSINFLLGYNKSAPLNTSISLCTTIYNSGQTKTGNFSSNFSVSNISHIYSEKLDAYGAQGPVDCIEWTTWADGTYIAQNVVDINNQVDESKKANNVFKQTIAIGSVNAMSSLSFNNYTISLKSAVVNGSETTCNPSGCMPQPGQTCLCYTLGNIYTATLGLHDDLNQISYDLKLYKGEIGGTPVINTLGRLPNLKVGLIDVQNSTGGYSAKVIGIS